MCQLKKQEKNSKKERKKEQIIRKMCMKRQKEQKKTEEGKRCVGRKEKSKMVEFVVGKEEKTMWKR